MATAHHLASLASALALMGLTALPSVAAMDSIVVHGRALSVEKHDEGERLLIDGKEVLRDYYLSVDRIATVGGATVVTGTASAGGNACEGAPFALLLGPGKEDARLDGPLETCSPMQPVEEAERLVFEELAVPGRASQRWTWTPKDGFAEIEAAAFKPDAAKGWAQLASDKIGHPADVLYYGPVAADADALLGADKAVFEKFVVGIGSAEREGDLISGSACLKFDCPDSAALVVADTKARKLYLAWKPAGEKIAVRPVVGEWPEGPRKALREWAADWN